MKTEAIEELLPCPFCGSKAVVDTNCFDGSTEKGWSASCTAEGSGCAGVIYVPNEFYPTREAAITAWNCRAESAELAALKEENERLREVLKKVEWRGFAAGRGSICPDCHSGLLGFGHEKDCKLKAALGQESIDSKTP